MVLAAIINAARVTDRDLSEARIAIVGAGAGGTATARLLRGHGVKRISVLDSQGALGPNRDDLDDPKRSLVEDLGLADVGDVAEVAADADVLIGLVRSERVLARRGPPAGRRRDRAGPGQSRAGGRPRRGTRSRRRRGRNRALGSPQQGQQRAGLPKGCSAERSTRTRARSTMTRCSAPRTRWPTWSRSRAGSRSFRQCLMSGSCPPFQPQ